MMVTHHTDLQGAVHTDTVKIFQVNKCCTREHHVHHFTKIYAQLNVWEQQGISIAVCLLVIVIHQRKKIFFFKMY